MRSKRGRVVRSIVLVQNTKSRTKVIERVLFKGLTLNNNVTYVLHCIELLMKCLIFSFDRFLFLLCLALPVCLFFVSSSSMATAACCPRSVLSIIILILCTTVHIRRTQCLQLLHASGCQLHPSVAHLELRDLCSAQWARLSQFSAFSASNISFVECSTTVPSDLSAAGTHFIFITSYNRR